MRKIFKVILSLLIIVIITEILYLLFIDNAQKTRNEDALSPPAKASPSSDQSDIEAIITNAPQQASSLSATYFPLPTSAHTPEDQNKITETTTKIYNIIRSTHQITKSTQLLQTYEGTIKDIASIEEDIFLEVYQRSFRMKFKISIQEAKENPKVFYYTQETLDKISVRMNSQPIDINNLQVNDVIRMEVTYDIDNEIPTPLSINIVKLNE